MGTISCLFEIADLEQNLFPETCYTAKLRGALQTCKQFTLKEKMEPVNSHLYIAWQHIDQSRSGE